MNTGNTGPLPKDITAVGTRVDIFCWDELPHKLRAALNYASYNFSSEAALSGINQGIPESRILINLENIEHRLDAATREIYKSFIGQKEHLDPPDPTKLRTQVPLTRKGLSKMK